MRVTFYTKENCQLCDTIYLELLDLKKEHGFSLITVDVEKEQTGTAYRDKVPVVRIESSVPGGPSTELSAPISQIALGQAIRQIGHPA